MVEESLKQRLLKSVRGSIPLTCAAFAVDNTMAMLDLSRADPAPSDHLSGIDIDADIEYARLVFDQYSKYGLVRGRVAEVGPGGSAAVALLLMAHGCESVDLVDRFAFAHDQTRLARTYEEIIRRNPALDNTFRSSLDLSPAITAYVGEDAAAEVFFATHVGYDAIVSCAVLEHLYDPIAAIVAMAKALNPGGTLVHNIDFRDHGMFVGGGHHELTFLTIPQWIYRRMSRRRGRPNRVLAHEYRAVLQRLNLDYRIFVTHLVGVGAVDPAPYEELELRARQVAEREAASMARRLARPFRGISLQDLATSGIIVSARKPA